MLSHSLLVYSSSPFLTLVSYRLLYNLFYNLLCEKTLVLFDEDLRGTSMYLSNIRVDFAFYQ